jgi:hypothetical protein
MCGSVPDFFVTQSTFIHMFIKLYTFPPFG